MRAQIAIALGFAAACSAGTYSYLDSKPGEAGAGSGKPATSEGPPPTTFGVTVGASMHDVEQATASAKCEDVSLMTIMKKAHAAHAGEAKGMPSDHLKMLVDPAFLQIRYACEDVPSPSGAIGRVLFVAKSRFDPLQTVAHQRHHDNARDAASDFGSTIALLEKSYGAPQVSTGDAALAVYKPVVREWHLKDSTIRVQAMNFGKRGASVSEEVSKS